MNKPEYRIAQLSDLKMDPQNVRAQNATDWTNPPIDIEELAADIKEKGLINAIEIDQNAVIISGHRRYAALRLLGETETTVKVVRVDGEVMRLLRQVAENIQRRNLEPLEEARVYQRLQELTEWKPENIAQRVNRSSNHVRRLLALIAETEEIIELVRTKEADHTAVSRVSLISDKSIADRLRERIMAGEPVTDNKVQAIQQALRRNPGAKEDIVNVDLTGTVEQVNTRLGYVAPNHDAWQDNLKDRNNAVKYACMDLLERLKRLQPEECDSFTKAQIVNVYLEIGKFIGDIDNADAAAPARYIEK